MLCAIQEPVKQLSKKEQKRLADEAFELELAAAMGDVVGVYPLPESTCHIPRTLPAVPFLATCPCATPLCLGPCKSRDTILILQWHSIALILLVLDGQACSAYVASRPGLAVASDPVLRASLLVLCYAGYTRC